MLYLEGYHFGRRSQIDKNRLSRTRQGWESYQSLFNRSEPLAEVIKDNPLIVVHPGYVYYANEYSNRIDQEAYDSYFANLKDTLMETLLSNRTVLLFVQHNRKQQTLGYLDIKEEAISKNLLFVPTKEDSVEIDTLLLGVSTAMLFDLLSTVVSQAEICGEKREQCLRLVKMYAEDNDMIINKIDGCIFPPLYSK